MTNTHITELITPTDARYDNARKAWNLTVDQRPAAIAMPRNADEIAGAVTRAAASGYRVAIQGTGHGAPSLGSLDGTVLVKTSAMRGVTIAPAALLARVEAGAVWADVVGAAAEHGLAALAGSSHDVGVAGYTLGGGVSSLSRRYGLAANSVLAAEVVTADGHLHRIDLAHEPDLFWALRGGGGSFAAVTALEIRLIPLQDVIAGVLFFPLDRALDVLRGWRRWVAHVPDEISSSARLLQFPPLPHIPEPVRGRSFVAVEIVHLGNAAKAEKLLAPLRELQPVRDTVSRKTPVDLLGIHMDPPGPVPGVGDGMQLDQLPAEAIDALLAAGGAGLRITAALGGTQAPRRRARSIGTRVRCPDCTGGGLLALRSRHGSRTFRGGDSPRAHRADQAGNGAMAGRTRLPELRRRRSRRNKVLRPGRAGPAAPGQTDLRPGGRVPVEPPGHPRTTDLMPQSNSMTTTRHE